MSNYLSDRQEDGLLLAHQGKQVTIAFCPDRPVLRRAAHALATDLETVTGCTSVLVDDLAAADIVIATSGAHQHVDQLVSQGLISSHGLVDSQGTPRWEGFSAQSVGEQFIIVGSDPRGAAFGVYDFAEKLGVSPWHWLADVPARTREFVTISPGVAHCVWPSVKYRGIFLNDEEELDNWARANTPDPTLGPWTYEKIFDLLLRLKANYIWPAMHVNAFNTDPRNGQLAHEMGIVVGTSHCDILMRSNENEFVPWLKEHNLQTEYDFSIPGQNRVELEQYWRGSIEQNKSFDVTWTVGMRGVHDSAFTTRAITENPDLSPAQQKQAQVELLGQAIARQRELLAEHTGAAANEIPQLFIPYKEVLEHYDNGLDLPQDITTVWVDDNFGYIRRFPTPAERERSGGHGLYYHISYWSPPPRSYLASSSTSLSLIHDQLTRSWDRGIRRLWVNNVGSLKPLELETEFFLRYAWDVGTYEGSNYVGDFLESFLDSNFDGDTRAICDILNRYYALNSQRKHEHLVSHAFGQFARGDEATARLHEWQELFTQVNAQLEALPANQQTAFFEVVAYKIHMAYLANAHFYHGDRSVLLEQGGHHGAARHHVEMVQAFYNARRNLTHFANTQIAGGKWAGMYTPEVFPPPVMPMFPAATLPLNIPQHGLGVIPWGGTPSGQPMGDLTLEFSPGGTPTKWIDLLNGGTDPASFAIDAPSWLRLSRDRGTVDAEQRILIEPVNEPAHTPRFGTITITSGALQRPIAVAVTQHGALTLPAGFTGGIEADAVVSLSTSPRASLGEELVEVLKRDRQDGLAPIEFSFFLTSPGAHLLEVNRIPLLNSTGSLRFELSINGQVPVLCESQSTDAYRAGWGLATLENVERLPIRLPYLESGAHTITITPQDQDLAISGLVIHTQEPLYPVRIGASALEPGSSTQPCAIWGRTEIQQAVAQSYRTTLGSAPVLPTIYTPTDFWDTATTFKRNVHVAQPASDNGLGANTSDQLSLIPTGFEKTSSGGVRFVAASALHQTPQAWHTAALETQDRTSVGAQWRHTAAVQANRIDLAVHIPTENLTWAHPAHAPSLHYRFEADPGTYTVWMLVHFEQYADSGCVISIDGTQQPSDKQFSQGNLFSFGTQNTWFWSAFSEVDLTGPEHTFSLHATTSRLRVQEIQLLPPGELPG